MIGANGNGNGHSPQSPQSPKNVISPQAMQAAESGQMPGPAIDVCGEHREHRHVIWPIPGQRDAIIIPFDQFKAAFAQLLQVELQLSGLETQAAAVQAPKIIVPQLDVRRLDIRKG